jgi:hypothetical protein
VSFRRRTYPEVLENLLTSLTGGVASESQPFPPPGAGSPPYTVPLLQPPAADVVSVWGSRDGRPHEFRKGIDYKLSADGRSLELPEKGAEFPDPGTLFYVNYVPAGAQPELTDLQVGSVVRTLVETTALELGRIHALLETVYQSAFVDTASGDALDNVVALLGIERVLGGRPAGEVEFTRARGTTGELTIPAGTRVATADGKTQYETTGTVSMSPGQSSIRVAVRDLEPNPPQPAGALTLLVVPIAGVESVTNPSPTAIATQDETDVELRTRAKNFLHGSERATLGALEHAVRGVGITADIDEAGPGKVTITPHVESLPPDLLQRLTESIELVRPAGVVVEVGTPEAPRKVDLELRLTTVDGLLAQDLRAAQRSVRDRIGDFFVRLPAKEAASINQLVGLALGVNGVQDVKLVTAALQPTNGGLPEDVLDIPGGQLAIAGIPAVLGELHIADPNLPTTLNVTVSYPPEAAPADVNVIRSALNDALVAVNEANGEDGLDLVYGQLLAAVPLPGHTPVAIPIPVSGTLPTDSDVAPYAVAFVFTLESGLSQILATAGETYAMTPFERLALGGVDGGASGG